MFSCKTTARFASTPGIYPPTSYAFYSQPEKKKEKLIQVRKCLLHTLHDKQATMSEPGPESVPTSADRRSKRPIKRRAVNTAQGEQASQIETLFRDPEREVKLPGPSRPKTSASLPPPPEIVANVQGSSAGAGSGEFHVYKASRRREYERLRLMQSEVDQEKGDAEWMREREETRKKDEEKTEKNRKRRDKRNAAKKKKDEKNGNGNPGVVSASTAAKGEDKMAVDAGSGVHNGAGDMGVAQAEETHPGVIIHDD